MSCNCDWKADGSAEFYTQRWVTARKAHTCSECSRQIAAGDRYVRYSQKWEGSVCSDAYCADCVRISEAHYAAARTAKVWADGYVLGELRCAVGCLSREEPEYRAAFRAAWKEKR